MTDPDGPPQAASRQRRLGFAGAVVAAAMTGLWLLVVPDKAVSTAGLQSLAIRFGHPAAWALLAAFGLSVATGGSRAVRDGLAWAALACYGAFLAALLL